MGFRKIGKIVLVMFVLIASTAMLMADQVADWDSDKLDYPIAVDGLIRHQEKNSYSFLLNNAGIPEEAVVFKAGLNQEIDVDTGIGDGSTTPLFDPEKIRFVTDGFTSYIGAKVTSISPGTTSYTDNGNVYEGEGASIDIIKGATAVLSLKYNPSYTHQTGAVWYCVSDPSYSDFSALAGSSYCTILGNETTDLSGQHDDNGPEYLPKTIRAVSIYDPWFDEMEVLYGEDARDLYSQQNPDADPEVVASVTWKSMYLKQSHETHYYDSGIWRYPEEDEVSIYTDYLVTVRSPIEMVTFTAKAEYQLGDKNNPTQAPHYQLFNDQIAHPDMTSTNKIWCYDTSDASAGTATVDAFRVVAAVDPDYEYTLKFELVSGSDIGHLDFTELDDNTFRFVPKGEYTDPQTNERKTNYGPIVIKATAEEVNFSKYFTLMYAPSNMKIVKYIGDDIKDKEKWAAGVQVDKTTGEVLETSGEWDVVTYRDSASNQEVTQLYGMECLVLYPGEVFELAMVQYIDNKDGNGKQPYYMTDGVVTVDYDSPIFADSDMTIDGVDYEEGDIIGYETDVTKYAITYSVTETSDPDDEPIKGILEFEKYGKVVEGFDPVVDGETEILVESATDTGQSWWYKTDSQRVVARKEGAYYLRYTVAPIEDEGPNAGQISFAESTLSGGINLYIVSPVNQALASVVSKQLGGGETIMLEIPFRISAGQRKPANNENGFTMPSHWYLGETRGAVEYQAVNSSTDDEGKIYYGSAYGIFSAKDLVVSGKMLSNFNVHAGSMVGIEKVDFGTKFLEIYNEDKGKPGPPNQATADWGGKLAISTYGKKTGPDISDVIVTGSYGLARFPGIRRLRIVDTATVNTDDRNNESGYGIFTEKNLSVEDGETIWDFREVTLTEYHHANMGTSGGKITKFYTPRETQVLNLDSSEVVSKSGMNNKPSPVSNQLDCDFVWGGNTAQNLRVLWIGNNRFKNFSVSGFEDLRAVFANGSLGFVRSGNDSGVDVPAAEGDYRTLSIWNNPKLELVQANNTFFNAIVAEFPRTLGKAHLLSTDSFTDSFEADALVYTIFRSNDSPNLKKVNVAGQLSYLELINDQALQSLIGTNTFVAGNPDNYLASSGFENVSKATEVVENMPENASYIRVVNLGSKYFISNQGNPEIAGIAFSGLISSDLDRYLYEASGAAYKNPAYGADDAQAGTNNIEVLKLNYVYRFFSAAENISDSSPTGTTAPTKPNLKTLEVFCLVPDQADSLTNSADVSLQYQNGSGTATETHLSSGNITNSKHVYSFDLRGVGDSRNKNTDILFHHVPEKASINLQEGHMTTVTVNDFQGFLSLYRAYNIDGVNINVDTQYEKGMSIVDLSRSGLKDFSGEVSFGGFNVSPQTLNIVLNQNKDGSYSPVTDYISVTASPSSFTSSVVVTPTSDDPSICSVAVSQSSKQMVEVTAHKAGTTTIRLGLRTSDGKYFDSSCSVTVNVTEVPRKTYEVSLHGGTLEKQPDGTEVIVLEYDTRNDPNLIKLELKVDSGGTDFSKEVFLDYSPTDPNNIFVDDDKVPFTYEEFYNNRDQMGSQENSTPITVVNWSFEETGHPNHQYAEIVLDSYLANRVYIKPLVDDQEYKGYVSYHDQTNDINFDASFIVRVNGGEKDRWKIIIQPEDDPVVIDGVGSSEILNTTLYDLQLLDEFSNPSIVSLGDYRENVVWSLGKGTEIASFTISENALKDDRIWLEGRKVGEDVAYASYRGVLAERRFVVDGVDLENPELPNGGFNVYDGASNRDNVWDIDWVPEFKMLSGTILPIDSVTGGKIVFDTPKGSFEFTLSGISGGKVSFKPNTDPDFRISLVATNKTSCSGGAPCTNGIPTLGQYSDSNSLLPSTDTKHNYWIVDGSPVFDIQPVMIALLNSGSVRLSELTFVSGGKTYSWAEGTVSRSTASMSAKAMGRASMLMKSTEDSGYGITLSPEEARYTQTFVVSSELDENPYLAAGVNPVGRDVEEVEESMAKLPVGRRLVSVYRSSVMPMSDTAYEGRVDANVYKIVANNCASLENIQIKSDQNKATARGLEYLISTGSSTTLLEIGAGAVLKHCDVQNCRLTDVKVQGESLEYLNVRNNKLGGGTLELHGFKYSNGSWPNGYVWFDRSGIDTVIAYGNGIRMDLRTYGGDVTIGFGSEIPSSTRVADVYVYAKADWWRSAGAEFYFGGKWYRGGVTNHGGWWFFGWHDGPTDIATLDRNISMGDVGTSFCKKSTQAKVNLWNGSDGWWIWNGSLNYTVTLYPFGE